MRIPILYIPKTRFKKILHIEKKYKSLKTIIPIGNDCHPAYTLQTLFLRKNSLPFDWLNINPINSIKYIDFNIRNQFKDFLVEPEKNERGYFVSKKYPDAEFMHEKELDTKESIEKFNRRISRLIKIVQTEKVIYLHNLPVNSIKSEDDIKEYVQSVKCFLTNLTLNSTLHIYLRYDENNEENSCLINKLIVELNKLPIYYCKYVRRLKDFGIWGNKEKYPNLIKSLKIDIKMTFPKIYIK
jgi:hypothetical protein